MKLFIYLLFNLLLSISSTVTQTEDYPPFLHTCFSNRGSYTANSIYRTTLNQILSDLPSTDNGYGFYNTSAGQNPNKAHAIGICRGDLNPDACRSCLEGVRNLLIEACPSETEAIGWYENCMLRFSNRSLHGSMEVFPAFSLWKAESQLSRDDVAAAFNRHLKKLLKTLKTEAAGGGNLSKFAAGSASVRVARNSNQLTIYALVQCTPDLSETDCKSCLVEAFGYIPICCDGMDTGRLVMPSCNLRFELSPFFAKAATGQLPSPVSRSSPPPISTNTTRISQGMKNKKLLMILIAIVATVLGIYMCYCLRVLIVDRKEKVQPSEPIATASVVMSLKMISVYVTQISYDDVKLATDGFADKRGEGGFGPVFKGRLNGQDIAVKILSTEHGQGDVHFSSEVAVLGNLRHGNLVKLLHFSVEGDERVLVYEYVPNQSLDRFIFDQNEGEGLAWDRRYIIIVGTARGLCYLHHNASPTFIHRDVKTSNILLDAEWNPKISDLGLAKLFSEDRMEQYTKNRAGSCGYMAPEYFRVGRYSVKSDVYSFGVVILEIVRGKKNSSFSFGENGPSLVNYAWENWGHEGRVSNLIDPMLRTTSSEREQKRCLKIALLCLQENEDKRPTMVEVVDMLTSNGTLPDPVRREQEPVLPVLEPQQALQAVSMRPNMVEVVDMLTSNGGTDTLPDPVRREQEPVLPVLEPQQALQAVSIRPNMVEVVDMLTSNRGTDTLPDPVCREQEPVLPVLEPQQALQAVSMRPTMVEVVDMLTSNGTLPDPVRREQEPVLPVLEPQQALQAVSRSVGSELGNTPITTNSGVVPVPQVPVENNANKMLAGASSSFAPKVSEFHRTRAASPPKIRPKQRLWIN